MTADIETTIAELRQRAFYAQAEVRRHLIEGKPTGPSRADLKEFERNLQIEVARLDLDVETRRNIRLTGVRSMAIRLSNATRAEIEKRLAPIAIPATTQD